MIHVNGHKDQVVSINCPEYFQEVEVHFPGGYTVKMAVRARFGDVASVYVTPAAGEAIHLVSVTETELIERKADHQRALLAQRVAALPNPFTPKIPVV